MAGTEKVWFCYMLQCRDGFLYVGMAQDVSKRLKRHNWGVGPEFTAKHRPVELVWSEPQRDAECARRREKEIKGWSREKKLRLIEGRGNPSAACGDLRVKGSRFNGRPPVSKTGCGGSNPSSPANVE